MSPAVSQAHNYCKAARFEGISFVVGFMLRLNPLICLNPSSFFNFDHIFFLSSIAGGIMSLMAQFSPATLFFSFSFFLVSFLYAA